MMDELGGVSLADGLRCTFRKLAVNDAEVIAQSEAKLPWRGWSKKQTFESLSGSHFGFGLCADDELITYSLFSSVADEAELLLLGTVSAWRRRGLARALMESVIENLRANHRAIFLEVRDDNLPALAFYEALGFNEVGLRPNYYPASANTDSTDARIFARELV